MDYHFNKVKCRKIEGMMPQLMKMVESGTVLFEAKDGAYEPLGEEDILK